MDGPDQICACHFWMPLALSGQLLNHCCIVFEASICQRADVNNVGGFTNRTAALQQAYKLVTVSHDHSVACVLSTFGLPLPAVSQGSVLHPNGSCNDSETDAGRAPEEATAVDQVGNFLGPCKQAKANMVHLSTSSLQKLGTPWGFWISRGDRESSGANSEST